MWELSGDLTAESPYYLPLNVLLLPKDQTITFICTYVVYVVYVGAFRRLVSRKSILSPFECSTASKGSNHYILFAITAAGVVPCGVPEKYPRTSSIVQIIFFPRSFEISNKRYSECSKHLRLETYFLAMF